MSLCLLWSMTTFLWSMTMAEQWTVSSGPLLKHTIAHLADIRAAPLQPLELCKQNGHNTKQLLSYSCLRKKPLKFSPTGIRKSSRQRVVTRHEITNALQFLEQQWLYSILFPGNNRKKNYDIMTSPVHKLNQPQNTGWCDKNKITLTAQKRLKKSDRESELEKAKENEIERWREVKEKVEAWGKRMIKRSAWIGVQQIDLWGLKSNCNGIVFPPISSTATKLLIDRREMRPPIPGAHPAVTMQDGHREEGEITPRTRGPFLFCSQSQSQIPGVGSQLVLNSIK